MESRMRLSIQTSKTGHALASDIPVYFAVGMCSEFGRIFQGDREHDLPKNFTGRPVYFFF